MPYIDRLSAEADVLIRNWWAVLLRGVLGVCFGLATFFWPRFSFAAIVLAFGAYALVDGAFALASAARGRLGGQPRWLLILRGLAGLGVGIVTLFSPGITAFVLLYLIAAWALVGGALEIAEAISLRKEIQHEWLLAISGVLSIALGVMLILFPAAGAMGLVLWVGTYAFFFGILFIALGFRLRAWGKPDRMGTGPLSAGPASQPAPSHP